MTSEAAIGFKRRGGHCDDLWGVTSFVNQIALCDVDCGGLGHAPLSEGASG
jgi:hypothetical protein